MPAKTCTYDCIYCQLGRTTNSTVDRREWFPVDEVLAGVESSLGTHPDYVTLSGSGEPTLYSELGRLIRGLKDITEVPVAVLTNGSLLGDPAVRDALAAADLVIPSLDAGDAAIFRYVNRPNQAIGFEAMVDGLATFGREYRGRLWLEVFLLGGVTGIQQEVDKISEIARRIGPERVQINTVTRPPACEFAYPVPRRQLEIFAESFAGRAEVIADYCETHQRPEFQARSAEVVRLLRRRPCTADDIGQGLGLHRNEVVKYLQELTGRGELGVEVVGQAVFYRARTREEGGG